MGASYPKEPVVLVFKTSNRSNARTKMKVYKNKNVDYVNEKKLPFAFIGITTSFGRYPKHLNCKVSPFSHTIVKTPHSLE